MINETAISEQSIRTKSLRMAKHAFCPKCEKLVELTSFPEATDLLKADAREMEWVCGAGALHRLHNKKGIVMICGDSLFRLFDNRQTRRLDPNFEMRLFSA